IRTLAQDLLQVLHKLVLGLLVLGLARLGRRFQEPLENFIPTIRHSANNLIPFWPRPVACPLQTNFVSKINKSVDSGDTASLGATYAFRALILPLLGGGGAGCQPSPGISVSVPSWRVRSAFAGNRRTRG